MSEQVPEPIVTSDQGDLDAYTWQHVATDMQGWPPDLARHAERLIAAHGITAPDPGEITIATTAAAEQHQSTPEERREAFSYGMSTMYKIVSDTRLHARCEEAGIDPFDTDRPEYWRMVADFTQERVAGLRNRGGDSFRLRALELVALTPAYLYGESALNQGNSSNPRQRSESLRMASGFHAAVTELVRDYPDAKASELTLGLLNSVNFTIEDKGLRQSAAADIRSRIRGIQHEVGFEDILRQTGMRYRKATRAEDLQGFDYVINEGEPTVRYIDVKASLEEVAALGAEGPVARNEKGIQVTYSMILNSELRDGFHLTEELSRDKAPVLLQYLYPKPVQSADQVGA
jgi:hypothetical protein